MNKPLKQAMRISRTTRPLPVDLPKILAAEQTIAQMSAAEHADVRRQIERAPGDGVLRLWNGLVLAAQGSHDAACEEFLQSSQLGCNNWRVGWYLAQSAKASGNIPLVDEACAAVLRASPEFWFARELPKHARGFYAQGDHDRLIEQFFQQHAPRTKVFVEVGAFDGVHYSNVRRLVEQHGWTGVSVEPVAKNFKKLCGSYRDHDVRCVQACASDTDGEVELNVSTYPHLPDWGSDVASVSGEDTERWRKQYGAVWTKEKVPARRLTSLLDEAGIREIDLLSVDAEGHDLEVLCGLDFDRFQPQLIVVEYGKQREAIASFLMGKGYSLQLDNQQDLFMARPAPVELRPLAPARLPERAGIKHYTGATGRPGYEEIQREVENGLHDFIGRTADDVGHIVIVGGYLGHEVRSFLRHHPRAAIHIFEPSQRYFSKLSETFRHEPRVHCHPLAVGERNGRFTFHEGTLPGVGSLLPLKTRPDNRTWLPENFHPAERYEVEVVALDSFGALRGKPIDLLWCDVQGAELKVLRGATETLGRTASLFLEVATTKTTYEGQCLLDELEAFAAQHGFRLTGLGLCPTGNGTGNGLWVRRPATSAEVVQPDHARRLVNPHLLALGYLPFDREVTAVELPATSVLTPARFDLAAKHLYARHRELGVQSGWARELYQEHLRAFSDGTFHEGDGTKRAFDDYRRAFDLVLDSIKTRGFDASQGCVPMGRGDVIIDGAHRVAACLLHGKPVRALRFDREANRYDSGYFRQRGLAQPWCDAIALEYCRLREDAFIVMLYPAAEGRHDEATAILRGLGQIAYEKEVQLNRQGSFNLIREVYAGEKWLGDVRNQFAGAWGKASPCFNKPGPLRVLVLQSGSLDNVRLAKQRLRDLFGIENHSVHINDTHAQTLQLARLLLNENSVHFLNHAQPAFFANFERQMRQYQTWFAQHRHDAELFCIDGSAVMAAYGIRDSADLDVLHFGAADFSSVEPLVNSHNSEVHHHAETRDDIIFNPANHFYSHGMKFASLDIIRRLKVKRNEGKDQIDVASIDRLLGRETTPGKPRRVINASQLSPVPKPEPMPFEFTNDWFATHQPHWDKHLAAWAAGRGRTDVLEIGSYEGRSTCWFLTRLLNNPASMLTCVDAWAQRSGGRVYEESMEEVFARFIRNSEATGRATQMKVHRGASAATLPKLPAAAYDLIYVDGDHSAEGVRADTLEAHRLLRPGGLLLWDDYYWADSVKAGVDKACVELGITVTRLGNNASFTKPLPAFRVARTGAKLVALVPARNEGAKLSFCFRALAKFVDAIVYLDDCSDDDTVSIAEALAAECRIERILRKNRWHRDEPADRNALLHAGREIGGTHFVVIDADEAFTANCAEGEALRQKILALQPGDKLAMTWIQLWRGVHQYRHDGSVWTNNSKPIIFCDDGRCSYSSEFIHTPRVPDNLRGRLLTIGGHQFGLLHFQFVNWRNLLLKQAWYRCIERVREPQKPVAEINARYAPSKDEADLGLKPAPAAWLAGYPFFDAAVFDAPDQWREIQVLDWFRQFGRDHFAALDIWDVDWITAAALNVQRSTFNAERSKADRVSTPLDLADSFVALADQEFTDGRLTAARDHLERAVDVAPERAEIVVALANLEFQLGNLAGAHQHLKRLVELKPDDADSLVLLASVSLKQGNVPEFERALELAFTAVAEHPAALRLLADLNLQQGRWPDAAKTYFRLLKQLPDDVEASLALGVCFFKTGDRPSAKMMFERVLELQPGHALAAENLRAFGGAATARRPLDEPPLVTAIVSTYNSESFMRGCLEDLEAQTIADRLEIIVVDSGSQQNERAIVEEFQRRHGNIVYLRTEREPLYAAWNRAVGVARGKYLTNANADDRHRKDAFEVLARALDEHPEGLVYADSLVTTVVNETFETTGAIKTLDWPEFSMKEVLMRSYFGPQPMWRRSVHDEVGVFDAGMKIAGDYDFGIRVAARFGARRVPEVLGLYLEGGMESKNRRQCVEETRRLLHRLRREIPIETVFPEILWPEATAERKAELLVDYAVTLSTTWHPDVELARDLYRCAAEICPEYVRALEAAAGRKGVSSGVTVAAVSPAKAKAGPRVSFCIITNGKRQDKLRAELNSIRALNMPEREILIAGDVPEGLGADVQIIPLAEAARTGRTSVLRNAAMNRARFECIVIADDDMLFHQDFYEGLVRFGEDYDVQCVRLLNPDGSRFWDWATVGGPRGQQLLAYGEEEPFLYITSGLFIIKRSVAQRVQWDEQRGYYQEEDVDFSRRLQRAGCSIRHNPYCTVTHSDARYTLDGPSVVRIEGVLELAKQDFEAGRLLLGRHRLARAVRLWPMARAQVIKFAAKFGEQAAVEEKAEPTARPNVLPPTSNFELKVPVRWAGPLFSPGAEADRAATLVESLARRIWIGVVQHGARWCEATVADFPETRRDVLFALADRYPSMLGGIGISQAVPDAFVKIPSAFWNVGFADSATTRLTVEQAGCCAQMDEVWVANAAQRDAFRSAGLAADKLHVVADATEVLARLRLIEQQLLTPSVPTRPHAGSMVDVSVAWDGSFLDLGSLSHVNRELTRALGAHAEIQLTRLGKNAVPKPLAGMRDIIECARQLRAQPPKPAQVTVRHAWPPNWDAPAAGAWVLIQPWEFGALPKEWVQNLTRVDEVWVPSDHVRRVYVDSGVEAAKVHVVPNGIDPQVFRPGVKPMALATTKTFKFLFIGGTILRKGPDVLLNAYLESFTAQDDVCLVIKDFGGQSVYAGQTFEAQVQAAQARPGAPEILYLTDELPPEALPGLYAACDCLVHPYRGEGFGLPILEAMACGLPVVVTAGGAADDFATDEFAYRVPSIRKSFGSSVSGMPLVKPGWMLEPDRAALVERMKWIVAHRDEARARGQAAGAHVRQHWTWGRAAEIAADRLKVVAAKKPVAAPTVTPPSAKPITLPVCGKLGHLAEARELFRTGKLLPAWKASIAALKVRPFHPEAFLLLAEIAQAAGDAKRAKELVERARQMAPKWKPARKLSKARAVPATVELPELPQALRTGGKSKSALRLSVFLITRNEERFIGQCLESVRDIASQVVVMDTGSTDWTKSVAERFGAEVYSFDWCDDFSAARNAALEKVTGDWVLMLDADEELLPGQKEKLRQLLEDPAAIAWRLPMVDKGREEEGVNHVPRLFRNAPGLFYVGRIHEQIFSSVEVRRQEWGLENKFGDVTLLHHGYTKEMVQSRDKIARNLRLLRLAIEEMPGEPNLLMNLGLELVRSGQLAEGLVQYAAAFAAMSALPKDQVTPELRESLLTQYASHLVTAKRPADAGRALQSPLAKAGGLTASMHWLLGLAFIEQRQFVEGAAQMRECLATRGKPTFSPVNRNILKGGPNHCLALCLSALKQRDAADKAFLAALGEEPQARSVRFDYARFLAEGGHEVESLKWLHQLMVEDASDVRVWLFGGQVSLSRPEFIEFANDWTGEAHKLHPTNAAIAEQRATALLLGGQVDAALVLWRELGAARNPAHRAAVVLCEVLDGRPVSPVTGPDATAVNQEFIQWYRRLLGANAERLVATLHQRLERVREVLPPAARMIGAAISEANEVPVK